MASLIAGYEYDIFISYRQKDNKYDGWVTEFVDNLKKELEATFKEEVSVYFDINPHDGLLETHDVDASLKEKLKCLVFIPIISRTYCDPKSFAWEHEFKAFLRQASQDKFDLKVKLSGGNVASRVLPIQIHDLNAEDKMLVEKELVGVLRSIEFIYKEPGVNRPLRPDDDDKINLNKTKYRNQINKVANAIDEILNGLKNVQAPPVQEKISHIEPLEEVKKEEKHIDKQKSIKSYRHKLMSGIAILVILIIATVLIYPKIFKRDTLEKLRSSGERISVAVMPFQNMTNDTTWNVWQVGIQNELITYLTNSEELRVRQFESISSLLKGEGFNDYASLTPSVASKISQKLDASVLIYGTIKQAGATVRLNAQLIDSKTEEAFKSFEINGPAKEDMIFQIIDSLKKVIVNSLLLTRLATNTPRDISSWNNNKNTSPNAYRNYINGNFALQKRDYPTARNFFMKAIEYDSTFFSATYLLSATFYAMEMFDQAKFWCKKAYLRREQLSEIDRLRIDFLYSAFFSENPKRSIEFLERLKVLDDKDVMNLYTLGSNYANINQYDRAIPELAGALKIYEEWGIKPYWIYYYYWLGLSYHKTGQYEEERKLYKKAEKYFPNDPSLIAYQAILSLSQGDSVKENTYIKKYLSILGGLSLSEGEIATDLGDIYSDAGILNRAEQYYRRALSLEQDRAEFLNNLGWFLIDKDRNIKEGLELIDKALKSTPDNYIYLDSKGWGVYKQGKYKESLEILQKSWDLRMKNAIYDHEAFLHLEAAKKAVANQKKIN